MDIITVEHLSKRFGDFEAVKDVSFSVKKGEIFGFLGPNGAGKTTTINVLCTLSWATSGAAMVNGFDVSTQRVQVRKSIGLVFQDTTLDDYLTAEQNLWFHAYAYGIPRETARARMDELLFMMELDNRRKDRIRNFSGGMRRRLEIVRGLLHHPSVLFLDSVHFILNRILGMHVKLHPDEISRVRNELQMRAVFEEAGFALDRFYWGPLDLFTHAILIASPSPLP